MSVALPSSIPLPDDWPRLVKGAFLCAVALAHRAMVHAHSWCINSRIERVRLAADNARLNALVAMLEEELRIKDSRLSRIRPATRPHYSPPERLSILALKASRAWNLAQTARAFLVTEQTIATWLDRVQDDGPNALVELPCPANKFPDFVTQLVQSLKANCPLLGKVRIAQMLARAGLHLSPSTVRRMLRRTVPSVPPTGRPSNGATTPSDNERSMPPLDPLTRPTKRARRVTAKYPTHVWHCDLTVVPTWAGFWIPWVPFTTVQVWPFCFWTLVVLDHFSRKAIIAKSFRRPPSVRQVTEALDLAVAIEGRMPKYLVSDRGQQFGEEYKDWCIARNVKPRFGAIGQHGSIALIERFNLSLKNECTRRIVVPLGLAEFEAEVICYLNWYNGCRPHQALGGRTPNEVYARALAARDGPRLETREMFLGAAGKNGSVRPVINRVTDLRLEMSYLEDRRHLPLVALKRAA